MPEMLRQLDSIRQLQRRLLPKQTPRLPGWNLAVHYAIGSWPGGDYYDFIPLPDGRLLLLVADGSDEGGPSVIMGALVHSTMHSCPLSSGIEQLPFCPLHSAVVQPPHLILGHLNRVLFENLLEEQFMSAFCGVLSPADGDLHFANAGYPAPRWWHAANNMVELLRDGGGLPLGVTAHAAYHHKHIDLQPGDLLVCSSDGLTAAQNKYGQLFGVERLDDAIRAATTGGADAVKSSIIERLNEFLGGREPQDDVTLIVLERVE